MILTETSPAPAEAVSSADFAAHLRVTEGFVGDPSEDALLALYLRNAISAIETRLGKALIRRGFKLTVARWNCDGHLVLPIGPVAAIDAITFVRGAATVAVSQSAWALSPDQDRQRVTGAGGGALPAIPGGHNAELEFEAGFGTTPADVPGDVAQAVMMLAAHYFENRYADGRMDDRLPGPVRALLSSRLPIRL